MYRRAKDSNLKREDGIIRRRIIEVMATSSRIRFQRGVRQSNVKVSSICEMGSWFTGHDRDKCTFAHYGNQSSLATRMAAAFPRNETHYRWSFRPTWHVLCNSTVENTQFPFPNLAAIHYPHGEGNDPRIFPIPRLIISSKLCNNILDLFQFYQRWNLIKRLWIIDRKIFF